MIKEYDSFADAYREGLESLLEDRGWVEPVLDEDSVGSGFGSEFRRTIELRPFLFRVKDPARCLIESPARQPSLSYVVGQWIWTMAGSEDLDQIAYYNRRGYMFSEDGARLPGAFGARIRRSAGDQLERALRLLRRDPGTRRASILIADAGDGRSTMRDFPCATGLHLMLRHGKLEMITSMRSQSALMVLPYDAALFMMLHVWAAAELGMECGPHTWIANSFHLYEDEVVRARQVLEEGIRPVAVPKQGNSPERDLIQLIEFERRVRALPADAPPTELPKGFDRNEFHGALASVLIATARSRCPEAVSPEQVLPLAWRGLWRSRPIQVS
jgi:thymidylate synthase